VRSFIVHRKTDTAAKVQALLRKHSVAAVTGMSSRVILDDLLSQPFGRRTLFSEWCNQMAQIAMACVA
jgi:hypothetical protein